MKHHLDEEMKRRNLDWIVLWGPRYCNPDILYCVGEVNILHPLLVKKCGGEMTVIHNALERGEVERLDMKAVDGEELLPREDTREVRSLLERDVMLYERLIARFGIRGRCAFYGVGNMQRTFFLFREIMAAHPEISLVCDLDFPLFHCLRMTKDDREIEIMRDVSSRALKIFEAIFSYLRSLRYHNEKLSDESGRAPLLGDLRQIAYKVMAGERLVASEIPIISMGRDAGIPHSTGDNGAAIEMGKTIVLDIFPRCASSSYHTDMTRTVCLGPAPPRVRQIYQHVKEAQELAMEKIHSGMSLSEADGLVVDYFEAHGYDSLRKNGSGRSGYTHSLGHGVGLELHEKPRISVFNNEKESGVFLPGMVFTVEPGLYFPDDGIGVRIEDIVALHHDSSLEVLSPMGKELEIVPEG